MWIVMTSSAKPKGGYGHYRNVALVKLHPHFTAWGIMPKIISERQRGVLRVRHLGSHSVGKTARCAFNRVLVQADALARQLNNSLPEAEGELLMSWGGSA